MGHYAAEMQCDKCGQLRCVCPPAPDTTLDHWVIAPNYKVMTVREFKETIPHSKFYEFMLKPKFASEVEAQTQAEKNKICDINDAREQVKLMEKEFYPDLPSTEEKLQMYEGLLHDIQLFSSVVMDSEKVGKLIDNINHWSYAHRCGNGEYSDEEQAAIVATAFKLLRKR